MKILIPLLLILSLTGCAPKVIYVDRPIEVAVATEVKLDMPPPPEKGPNRAVTLLNILKYKDELKTIVKEHSNAVH